MDDELRYLFLIANKRVSAAKSKGVVGVVWSLQSVVSLFCVCIIREGGQQFCTIILCPQRVVGRRLETTAVCVSLMLRRD